MKRETKIQAKRRIAYYRQLRKCGFTSWKAASMRRGELLSARSYQLLKGGPDGAGLREELEELGKLVDLRAAWKTNGELNRRIRAVKRLQKKLGYL